MRFCRIPSLIAAALFAIGANGAVNVTASRDYVDRRLTSVSNSIIEEVSSSLINKADKSDLEAHVWDYENPHVVTAEQTGAVPLVEDVNREKTAVTIGSRAGTVGPYSLANGNNVTASGSHSHAEGDNTFAKGVGSHAEGFVTTAPGEYSHSEGYGTIAAGDYSHAGGHDSMTRPGDSDSFAWSGIVQEDDTKYSSHGQGTFNINPVGGLDGFYIGEKTLSEAISDGVAGKADKDNVYTKEDVDSRYSAMSSQIGDISNIANILSTTIDQHIRDTNNPHKVTAAQVGSLPLTGGTLTGDLAVGEEHTASRKLTVAAEKDVEGITLQGGRHPGRGSSVTVGGSSGGGGEIRINGGGSTGGRLYVGGYDGAGGGAIEVSGTGASIKKDGSEVATESYVNTQVSGVESTLTTLSGAVNAKADKTTLEAHVADTNNPHGVTAAQVGALPLYGGRLYGDLTIIEGFNFTSHNTALYDYVHVCGANPRLVVGEDPAVEVTRGGITINERPVATEDYVNTKVSSAVADKVTSSDVATALEPYLKKSGGTVTGNLTLEVGSGSSPTLEVSGVSSSGIKLNAEYGGKITVGAGSNGGGQIVLGDSSVTGDPEAEVTIGTVKVRATLAAKADKATTLAGYGITDAATKTELDAVDQRAANAFSYLESNLASKADKSALDNHEGNMNNPHAVTAAQVGALPLTGGTLTGQLNINDSMIVLNGYQSSIHVFGDDGPPGVDVTSGGIYILGKSAATESYVDDKVRKAVLPTDPTFSNAVLSVGLNIDTNSVAVLNEIASTFGGFPLEGTATTVGGLLAALAAAIAWLKKNKVGSFASVGGASATVENGVAKLDDFFTESNSLLTATIDARLPYPLYAVTDETGLLKDRAINTTSLASVTVPENFTDLIVRASVASSLSVTMPDAIATKYGDTFPGDGGEYLVTITKTGASEAYVRTIKLEVANA